MDRSRPAALASGRRPATGPRAARARGAAWLATSAAIVLLGAPAVAGAQHIASIRPATPYLPAHTALAMPHLRSDSAGGAIDTAMFASGAMHFRDRADSLQWVAARDRADGSSGFRIVVSLFDRHLWVLSGDDTLRSAPVAVGMGTSLSYHDHDWTFDTPRGVRRVQGKEEFPVWVPPLWHYVEIAKRYHLKLAHLPADRPVTLSDGSKLEVRFGMVGIQPPDSAWTPLPTDEEIVFDSTVYVPPVGTANRKVYGELGQYRLELGDGYLLHGTPHLDSIGYASTHGCIRLRDEDIAWLYEHVPVGTRVYIY